MRLPHLRPLEHLPEDIQADEDRNVDVYNGRMTSASVTRTPDEHAWEIRT